MHFKLSIVALCFLIGGAIGCGRNGSPPGTNASQTDFAIAFQNEFGFVPPPGTADGKTKSVRVGDTLSQWFSFDYQSNIFQRITNQNFVIATSEEIRRPWEALWSQDLMIGENPNAPDWWPKAPRAESEQVYYRIDFKTNFNRSYVYLWIDSLNRRVYATSVAWN